MPSFLSSEKGVTAGRVVADLAARAKWNHRQMQPSSCRMRLQQLDLVSLFRPVAQNQRRLFGALKRQLSKLAPLEVTSLSASISDSLPTTSMSATTSSTTTSTTTVKGGMQLKPGGFTGHFLSILVVAQELQMTGFRRVPSLQS